MPQIRTIELDGGEADRCCPRCKGTGRVKGAGRKRYTFVVDVGRGQDGRRRQRRYTFSTEKAAKAKLAEVTHTVNTGSFVDRSKITVNEVCDRYLRKVAFGREENTKLSYRLALEPVRAHLGDRKAQDVDREDVEQLRDWMLAEGRKRGPRAGTGLGPRSVRLTLGQMQAAFDLAIRDRLVTANPLQYVELPEAPKKDPDTWSAAQVRAFLAEAGCDRLHAAWRLSLYGLRRAEVCGLRWEDVDLKARTLTIAVTRPMVSGKVIVKAPKSRRGIRTLPIDEALAAALQALHDRQVTEAMEAGKAYEPSGYVVTDELGRPMSPDFYSDEFHRVRERAGVERITLRNIRATANTLMADAGIPDHIRAGWCGHTEAVNRDSYTAVRPESLKTALDVLSAVHNAAEKPL